MAYGKTKQPKMKNGKKRENEREFFGSEQLIDAARKRKALLKSLSAKKKPSMPKKTKKA